MELIRGLHNLRVKHQGSVATIGNFDGVHLGHQRILQQTKAKAKALNLPSVAITFEPHPWEFFSTSKDKEPGRLTRFSEKIHLLEQAGLDRVLCLNFNTKLQLMTADEFIDELLLQGLGVKHFVVGDDFRFGRGRTGDYGLLQAQGKVKGFTVANTETYLYQNERVSSTRIRQALAQNNLDLATQLLGRSYEITGRVLHGQKLGRQLGFPTANVRMHRFPSPLQGVYAVRVKIHPHQYVNAVCNIGIRPTLQGQKHILEVHLLDFDADLYNQLLSVEFLQFIRPEQKFSGLETLKQQIFKDIEQTRNYFAEL